MVLASTAAALFPKVASLATSKLGKIGGSLAVGGLAGLFNKGDDIELKDIRTPEQKAAAASLQGLAQTGTGAGITLGGKYGGKLGSYQQSPEELNALQTLTGLAGGDDLSQARSTFMDLANTSFDPSDPKSGYAAYSKALAAAGEESSDVLEREAAITGSRYGTAISGEKRKLAENLQTQRATFLSDLYQRGRQQQLAGAQGLQGLVGTQAGLAGQIQQQAAIERQLKDQQAKEGYTEFKRARMEELSRIDLLQTEASRNPYLGVSSLPGSPSPFSTLANSVLGSIGERAGEGIAEGIFGKKEDSGLSKLLQFGTTKVSNYPRRV